MSSQGTLLEEIEDWSPEQVQRLRQSWITTAEQVVAISATPEGLKALAEQLDVSVEEASRLVASARAHLTPERAAELDQPADTSDYGLGALRPPPPPQRGPGN